MAEQQVFASRALPTLAQVLDDRASRAKDRPVYVFLRDGEVQSASITFGELRRRAVAVAARLASLDARGDRAMLLYPQGLEFLVAFFGCLYSGAVAVPVSIPGRKTGLESLRRIAADASIRTVLSTASVCEQFSRNAADLPIAATSWIDTEATLDAPTDWVAPAIERSEIALLQYTSGSTGSPRGVAVTHGNLAHNQWQIEQCFGDHAGRLVSWLPMFHDMGLGTVLQAIWAGGWCALMPPHSFLQSPGRWLRAISKYRATVSGAPDFAFDLCARRIRPEERAGLDLSSWRVAYNGSEPVRAATIERFVEAFSGSGFRRAAFHPVYGLAEATVLVASEHPNEPPVIRSFTNERIEHRRGDGLVGSARGQRLVSCGGPWPGTRIAIVDPETRDERRAGTVGEIWVQGDSVAAGYWGMENETAATFRATTSEGEGPFLRTGDLGFVDDNHLFITGRLKDLIIIRGINHYPQDIEASVSDCHAGLAPNGCAAFSIEGGLGECLIVVQEVARSAVRKFDASAAVAAIRRVVSDEHGLQAQAVVLVKPSTLPRTSSGKVRRNACRSAFLGESLDTLVSWEASGADRPAGDADLAAGRAPASARADGIIEWLRHHAADIASNGARDEPLATESLLGVFGQNGLFGMQVEQQYGGLGLGHLDSARVLEQLAAIELRLSGMNIARESMVNARLAIGAACIGGMKRCAQLVGRHGPYDGKLDGKRTPNPVVLARLGSMTARITALECLVHRVARALDGGRKVPAEAFAACRVLGPELLVRSVDDVLRLGLNWSHAESHRLACLHRDGALLRHFDGSPEAVSEVAGAVIMDGDESLGMLIEDVFDAPDIQRRIDGVVEAVRERMRTLDGALARRRERWAHTRAGQLTMWLLLLAAVDAARREIRGAELERAHAWALAQFEDALAAVRSGTPSEVATVDPSDVAGAFAAYASTIGELGEGPAPVEAANTTVTSLGAFVAGTPPRASASLSKDDLQAWIVSWLARRLRVPISQVEVGRSFADHGLDSVAAVELSTELSEMLGCRLDETLLWNFPTIQALAEWSLMGRPHVESRFEADAVLEAGVRPPAMSRAEPASVLLTGATGFLGAFLLYELLVRTRCHVTCLVRAADTRAGVERVARNLRKYELWNDEVASRFSVLVGDLEQPSLGLGPAAFHHLVEGVDAIYNNGARLSFVAGYDDLKPSHVNATREILRLASRGRPKAVHHISSIAVFDAAAYRGRTLSESTPPVESRGIHLPYAQCKWLSETLVRAAAARGIPVTIHRPGLIAGSSSSGAWSNADFLCRMLKAVIEMRCMPGDLDLELDFSPVDYVSRAIVHLSRQSASVGRAFHLQHPRALHLEQFGQILRSLGYEVTPVSYHDWVDRIRARPDGPLYPLVPFLAHRWHPEERTYVELAQRADRPRLRCDETFEALASSGIECPPLDSHLIARYVHYLTRIGFLGGRARETSPARPS